MKMQEHFPPEAASPLAVMLAKFLPPAIGALLMAAVALPKDKRELFLRVFVAMASSYLFGGTIFDWLHSMPWGAFLDTSKREHHTAIDGLIGATGWFLMGAGSEFLARLRRDPSATIKEIHQ